MAYNKEIKPLCKEQIEKACRKNPILKKAIENKISEIIENPYHSCLNFKIDEQVKRVIFIFFGNHDEAY